MTAWPEFRDGDWLMDVLGDREAAEYWGRIFEDTWSERNTSWAYRWMFAAWAQSGLTVLPNVNLVTNIGFGHDATHTVQPAVAMSELGAAEMAFPLRHPPFVVRDARADEYTQRRLFSTPGRWRRAANRATRLLSWR